MQPTTRLELTNDEITRLARRAGELARRIDILDEQRKEAAKEAKAEIDELKAELGAIHEWLRTGVHEVSAQGEMFDPESVGDRLDHCRRIVREARARQQEDDA